MANLEEHLVKAKALTESQITHDLFEYIRRIEPELVHYNVSQINNESKDIFGNPIGFYSKATEVISKGRKPEGDPFTGHDTGSWLNSFYLKPTSEGFQFSAHDPKTSKILSSTHWLSKDLFGLSDANLSEAIHHYFLPFFNEYFRRVLL